MRNVMYGSKSFVIDNPEAAKLVEIADRWRKLGAHVRAKAILKMAVRVEANECGSGDLPRTLDSELPIAC